MKKYFQQLLLTFALLLGMTACNEFEFPTENKKIDPKDCYALSFNVSVNSDGDEIPDAPAATAPKTRAMPTEDGNHYAQLNENKVENMHMFLYAGEVQAGYFSTAKGDLVMQISANPTEGKATAYIPKDNPANPHQNKQYEMYVLTNYSGASLENLSLTDLRNKVQETGGILQQNTVDGANITAHDAQPSFLMDGKVSTGLIKWVAGTNVYTVPTKVELRRAAAKIRVLVESIDVKDKGKTFQLVGNPQFRLMNGVASTTLFQNNPWQDIPNGGFKTFSTEYEQVGKKQYDGKEFWARSVPYYTYENSWRGNSNYRTTVSIKLRLSGVNDSGIRQERDFYYSVPINYLVKTNKMSEEEKAGIGLAQRNHLYDVRVRISQLGDLDPGTPEELSAHISIEDWNEQETIDGNIQKAHYLVVKEPKPDMRATDTRLVEYLSDLDLNPTVLNDITASFTGYDYIGDPAPVSGKRNDNFEYHYKQNGIDQTGYRKYFKDIQISTTEKDGKKFLVIKNPVPNNYVPWTIKFRAQHVAVPGETGTPLFQDVEVTQYPPIYVTAEKSKGPGQVYWYSPFGAYNSNALTSSGSSAEGYQTNGTLYKVTVLVPQEGMIVGNSVYDGTDSGNTENVAKGRTNRSAEANKIVSPQFIIASQWGMSPTDLPQYSANYSVGYAWAAAALGKANLRHAPDDFGYSYGAYYYTYQYRDYNDAVSRAERYWEDDYGISGTRQIWGIYGSSVGKDYMQYSNNVTMNFKYNAHWRIPTVAELQLIIKIQSDINSAIKALLWGQKYWSAKEGVAVNFANGAEISNNSVSSVRAIFDTYKFQ